MQRNYGISDEGINGFISNEINRLNKEIQATYNIILEHEKKLEEYNYLKKHNTDPELLKFLHITTKKVWTDDWDRIYREDLFNKFKSNMSDALPNPQLKQAEKKSEAKDEFQPEAIVTFALESNQFADFYNHLLIENKIKFEESVNPYTTFQNIVIEFLKRAYIYNVLSHSQYMKDLKEHYKKIIEDYFILKMSEKHKTTLLKTDKIIKDKLSLLNDKISNFISNNPLVSANILAELKEIFPEKSQVEKVSEFLKRINTYKDKPTELEQEIEKFATQDIGGHWFKFMKGEKKRKGWLGKLLLNKKFNPSLADVKVDEKENLVINFEIAKLKELFNQALKTDSEVDQQAIISHCDGTIKLNAATLAAITPIIRIVTTTEIKNELDRDFADKSMLFSNDLEKKKTILKLYEFLSNQYGNQSVWKNYHNCFQPNPQLSAEANKPFEIIKTIVSFQTEDNFNGAINETEKGKLEWSMLLTSITSTQKKNSKTELLNLQELHLCDVLKTQVLLAARLYLEKYNRIDKAILEFIQEIYHCDNYVDYVSAFSRVLLGNPNKIAINKTDVLDKDAKNFALCLLSILHDEELGLFYLIEKNYDNYVKFSYDTYFIRPIRNSSKEDSLCKESKESELRSTVAAENFLKSRRTSDLKLKGNKAKEIQKLEKRSDKEGNAFFELACVQTHQTLQDLENQFKALKPQLAIPKLFYLGMFNQTQQIESQNSMSNHNINIISQTHTLRQGRIRK